MPVTKLNSFDEVWKLSYEMGRELMEDAASEMSWDALIGSDNMQVVDFVEKRFIGLPDYIVTLPRRLGVASQRLEHIEDSPRKEVAKAFINVYKDVLEEHLDHIMGSTVFNQVSEILYSREYSVPQPVRNEVIRKNREHGERNQLLVQDMQIYDSLFKSFFTNNGIPDRMPSDQSEMEAEQRVFARIAQALPQEPEFEIFGRREGYINQPAMVPVPDAVTLVMEPSAISDVTVNNFAEKIHGTSPDRVVREWGVGTFDRMMAGIYTDDALKQIKQAKTSLLSTVFVDGQNVREWMPLKPNETEKAYEDRVKCELVAYALEGKGKVDICPLVKAGDGYEFGDPVPMRVKVNLKEEIPVWKRALRFFHIKSETKKEKAERVSLEDLKKEDRLGAVRQQLEGIREREGHRQMASAEIKQYQDFVDKDDQAYFGFLGDSEQIRDGLKKALENDKGESLLNTMNRSTSRGNFVRLFALTRGMTIDQVLSADPAYDERKREIGQELVERFGLMGEAEYKEKNGAEADYDAYMKEKREMAFETVKEIHQSVKLLPYSPMPDTSPKTLADNYKKNHFMGKAMGDYFQCIPDSVRQVDRERFEAMTGETRAMSEIRHAADYVETMASDGYVVYHATRPDDIGDIVSGIASRENMNRYQKDTAACTLWGQVAERIDDTWCMGAELLKVNLREFSNDPANAWECGHYLSENKEPVCVFDERTKQFQVGKIQEISKIKRNADLSWQDEFQEIDQKDIEKAENRIQIQSQKVSQEIKAQREARGQEQKLMKQTIEKSSRFVEKDDQAYFGSLGGNAQTRAENLVAMVQFEKTGENVAEKKETEMLMNTMHRISSRVSIVRAYALTKGMTMEEILSDDPSLDERKAQIGREFVGQVSHLGKEEYARLHGSDAGYEQYAADKQKEVFQMAQEIHQKLVEIPYTPLPDVKPETLRAAYERTVFIRDVSQDFSQVFEPLEATHKEEFDRMTTDTRSMGELRYMKDYCDFLASDSYVLPDTVTMKDETYIASAVLSKENLERYMADTKEVTTCGQLSQKIDEKWTFSAVMLQGELAERIVGKQQNYLEAVSYITTGKDPICYFDKTAEVYQVGSPQEIARIQKEKEMSADAGGKTKIKLEELGDSSRHPGKEQREKKNFGKEAEKVSFKEELKMEKGGSGKGRSL